MVLMQYNFDIVLHFFLLLWLSSEVLIYYQAIVWDGCRPSLTCIRITYMYLSLVPINVHAHVNTR